MQLEKDQEQTGQKTETVTPIKGAKFSDHLLPKVDIRAQTSFSFNTRPPLIKSIAGK
jgi:hypothetical protein